MPKRSAAMFSRTDVNMAALRLTMAPSAGMFPGNDNSMAALRLAMAPSASLVNTGIGP